MSGYLVSGQIEVSVFINDTEYPLGAINLLQALHICTTVRASVPLLSMRITDVQHLMERIGLQDGVPIRVVIKAQNKDSKTYNFRAFSHKKEQAGSSFVYQIYGVWDSPMYWTSTTAAGLEGTSNDVLQQIAQKCGLKYSGVSTGDSQVWLPQNKLYRMWAKDIAAAGYVNDMSCMALGLDLDNTLVYRNINKLDAATKTIVAYQYKKDAFTATDFELTTESGFNNAITGYQNMRYAQSSVADEIQQQIKSLTFKADVKAPLYNTELRDKVGRGAVRFGPIDCGNVHQNYEKAKYQNIRYANLFNLGIRAMVTTPTNIQLLEAINFSVQKENTDIDTANSGIYTVTGHSIYVEAATYAEQFGLARHGINEVAK